MEGKAINSADAISHTFWDWEQAQAFFFFFFPAVLPQNIYVEIKTKTMFLLLFKFGEQGKVHTNYVLPGRLGAREVEELGEEERERSSREEGERSPGLNRFHSKDFFLI